MHYVYVSCVECTGTYPAHQTANSYKLNIWDVGGQKTIRSYWRNYFEQVGGALGYPKDYHCASFSYSPCTYDEWTYMYALIWIDWWPHLGGWLCWQATSRGLQSWTARTARTRGHSRRLNQIVRMHFHALCGVDTEISWSKCFSICKQARPSRRTTLKGYCHHAWVEGRLLVMMQQYCCWVIWHVHLGWGVSPTALGYQALQCGYRRRFT